MEPALHVESHDREAHGQSLCVSPLLLLLLLLQRQHGRVSKPPPDSSKRGSLSKAGRWLVASCCRQSVSFMLPSRSIIPCAAEELSFVQSNASCCDGSLPQTGTIGPSMCSVRLRRHCMRQQLRVRSVRVQRALGAQAVAAAGPRVLGHPRRGVHRPSHHHGGGEDRGLQLCVALI